MSAVAHHNDGVNRVHRALNFDRANLNWQWRCCLLLLVATVPSSDACVMFTAKIFNSLITIQTESSLY